MIAGAMDDGWRGMFESFANALIERGLPRVRDWLAERFGPGATLGSMEVEGKRVHLNDVRIPLGTRVVVTAKRATLLTRGEDLVSGGFDALALDRLEGAAIAMGAVHARVAFEGDPSNSTDWVRGRLVLEDVAIGGDRFEGQARVRMSAREWAIEDGAIERGGARMTLAMGGGVAGGRRIAHARSTAAAFPSPAVIEILAAIGIALPPIARSISARVSGSASWDPAADRIAVNADARTDASFLTLELEAGSRAIKRASVRGKVGWDDVLAPDLRAHVRGASPITVSLDGTGLADARGSLRCPQLDLRWLKTPLAIDVHVDAGRAELDAGGDGVSFKGEALQGSELRGGGSGTVEPRVFALGELGLDGSPISFGVLLRGSLRAPKADVTLKSDRLLLTRGESALAVSKVRASARGSAIDASARMGRGTIAFAKNRLRAERIEAAPIAAMFGVPVPFDGALWADVNRDGTRWEGTLHLEGARSRITASPLRFDGDERALDGTKLAAILGAADLTRLAGIAVADGSIDLELALEHAPIARLMSARGRGIATSRALEIGRGRTFMLSALRVPLAIEGGRASVDDGSARLFGGEVRGSGALDRSGLSVERIAIDGVGAGLARWLGRPELLPGLSIDGVLARDGHALAGTIDVRSARSSLSVRPRLADNGALDGSDIDGELEVADLALGSWAGEGRWSLRGKIEGTFGDPRATIDARAERQVIHAGPASLPLEELRVALSLGRDRIVWSDLSARLHGGELRSRGRAGASSGAHLELEGVDLGAIEALGDYAGGRATLAIDAWRGPAGTLARASVRLDDPRYAFLTRARPTMERLGLRSIALDGTAPFTAIARFANGRLRVSEIGARVPEVRVEGAFSISPELADGRLVLTPDAEWVRESPYLSPFADLLADAGLPILLGGAIGELRVRPDYGALGGHLLARSPIGRRLRRILERAFPDAFERPSRPDDASAHRASALLSTDAILDRLAGEADDAEELFDQLLDRGMTPDEIAARVTSGGR